MGFSNVDDVGQEGVKKAGDMLSQHYDDAIDSIRGVKFDAKFDGDLMTLRAMSSNLVPVMAKKFDKVLNDTVISRMSPNRSMLGDVWKSVESDVGKMASKYSKSSTASEQELGDALTQLQELLKQQMLRSNPQVANAVNAADKGWAQLVRVEQAAKAAKNNEGLFTPAQLNAAIQSSDDSVRGRAVARGTALMQDLGTAGQKVIGNKYPDSGTAGRLMTGIGTGGFLALLHSIAPTTAVATGAGLAIGRAAYTKPAQRALLAAVARRPENANAIAELLRKYSVITSPAASTLPLAELNANE